MDEQAVRDSLEERFIRYCQIDSGSVKEVDSVPSTGRQRTFVEVVEEDAKGNGFHTEQKDWGLYVRLNGNTEGATPFGLSAHADTSSDAPNEGVEVILHRWKGENLTLPATGEVIPADASEQLASCRKGDTIYTSNGETLLGADDKAGITIGMESLLRIKESGMQHGDIELAITYDEETGLKGAQKISSEDLRAKFVLVYDATKGEMGTGTFNAASAYPIIAQRELNEVRTGYAATVTIHGKNTFPGFGKKDKMVDPFRVLPAVMRVLEDNDVPVTGVKCDNLDTLELMVSVEDAEALAELGNIEDARENGATIEYSVDESLTDFDIQYDLSLIVDLVNAVPYGMSAEMTEGREGYIQPYAINVTDNGDVEVHVLLRDHDKDLLEKKRELVRRAIPGIRIKEEYQNKEAALAEHPEFMDLVDEAFAHAGVEKPLTRTAIRGGDESFVYTVGLGRPSVNVQAFLDESIHTVRERGSLDVMHQGVKANMYIAKHFAQGKD